MKVYIGPTPVSDLEYNQVIDFLRPVLNVRNQSISELKVKFGNYFDQLKRVDTIEDSNFCALPVALNWYYLNNKLKEVQQFSDLCRKHQKYLLVFIEGDFGVKPIDPNHIIIRSSGYQSKRLTNQHAATVYFPDPVKGFFKNEIKYREKESLPVVGFCGQAASGFFHTIKEVSRTIVRNGAYYLTISPYEPQVISSSTSRRASLLKLLTESELVNDQFIIRHKYRAGAVTKEERSRSALEFYNNIKNTDYTLCVRGGGNFSVRIYETLAMGRIPLFVNTDCILPLDHIIDWKKHVVWIEESEINKVDQLLADFHNEIHVDDFIQMQINNRNLWKEYISGNNFHEHLMSHIIESLLK